MKYSEHDLYLIAVASVYDMQLHTIRAVVRAFPEPERLIEALGDGSDDLNLAGEQKKQLLSLVRRRREVLERLAGYRVFPVTMGMNEYPRALAEIPDPPEVLFCKGDLSLLNSPDCLSVIGSRSCTRAGETIATRIAGELAQAEITIVSGMARGIDGIAQRAALEAGGKTIAVLGSGLNKIYPPENADLFERVAENGLLVTEYGMNTEAMPYHFPQRNRIISGLARGVLVVEAGEKSGALITVRCALEQGRDVFAVPGSVLNANAEGTNALIKDGAVLVRNAEDILREYADWAERIRSEKTAAPELDEEEARVAEALKKGEAEFDVIVARTGIDAGHLGVVLTKMNLRGIVMQSAGNRYELCIR
ncbi:MAG: DNA-processing protein DprA [Eubacteriales bacterium]|nr:DNA-processing protein DprA [Eubacteriales bacterium]